MKPSSRQLLITSALPYANGPLHLGHLLEFIQTDIWVRFQRLMGHCCWYICGDDAHGTPIMLKAQEQGITADQLVHQVHAQHESILQAFNISLDNFYTTHSEENRLLAEDIYLKLSAAGDNESRTIKQAYDAVKNMFLPDRFIKGGCPKCKAEDQYGDSCEVCGAIYSPADLIAPVSVLSGTPPVEKESEHYFFNLPHYEKFLKEWLQTTPLQAEIVKKLQEWFEGGLKSWDISRDAPYFGFKIPHTENKYFYVWLDAPIGYIASFKNLCQKNKQISFESFWHEKHAHNTELYHFIGKDIVYFHALFWPAVLKGSGYRRPSNVFVHGFVTVNGQKMSKSKGTFITGERYLKSFNPEYLRYYFAAKLTPKVEDLDFQSEDFSLRINADLVGKLVNIASRSAAFIDKNFDHQLAKQLHNPELLQSLIHKGEELATYFESRDFAKAVREIMALADEVNRYIDSQKPWVLIKTAENSDLVHAIVTTSINAMRILMTYLSPILPDLAQAVSLWLNLPNLNWQTRSQPLLSHTLNPFKPLVQRLERTEVDAMFQQPSSQDTPMTAEPTTASKLDIKATISIEDFAKIDLRIARIVAAEAVLEADKLLKLTLDLGEEQRQVFAGIKSAYSPEDLIGKLTVMVANLAPRKMRFGLSEGMVLAAGPGGKDLWILEPDQGAQPGMTVK